MLVNSEISACILATGSRPTAGDATDYCTDTSSFLRLCSQDNVIDLFVLLVVSPVHQPLAARLLAITVVDDAPNVARLYRDLQLPRLQNTRWRSLSFYSVGYTDN